MATKEELFRSLTNITPAQDTIKKIEDLRDQAKVFMTELYYLPDSREKSIAITKLEESLMWAVKSLVLYQPSSE